MIDTFPINSFQWHGLEMENCPLSDRALVWIKHDFFFDEVMHRPKIFWKKDAHLYAIMYILSGKAEFVFVQNTRDFFKAKYGKYDFA